MRRFVPRDGSDYALLPVDRIGQILRRDALLLPVAQMFSMSTGSTGSANSNPKTRE